MESREEKNKKHISLKKMKLWKRIAGSILLFLGLFLLSASLWSNKEFGVIDFGQILYHLFMPLDGSDSNFIVSFILYTIPISLIITTIANLITADIYKKQWSLEYRLYGHWREINLVPATYLKKYFLAISSLIFMVCVLVASYNVRLPEYVQEQSVNSMLFEDYYVEPSAANLTFPDEKRNLVFIFVESMENTYLSKEEGGAFEQNLIPELTELAKENINFSNTDEIGGALPLQLADYTVSSMIANTSGLPIKIPLDSLGKMQEQNGNTIIDSDDSYLGGFYSIGEVLDKEGYNQVMLMGSDGNFGGRKSFFQKHGNYRILDYYEAIDAGAIPEDYNVFWGYEDATLFSIAKDTMLELAEQEEPFNITMLTVDTHFYDGYLCELCEDIHDTQYENVISCSSRQVVGFVEWVQEQDFYENTTIIIVGDHPTMDVNFIPEDYVGERTTYSVIINAAVEAENDTYRQYTSVDMYPTTLAAMGVEIEGNRLGLGTNLFSKELTLCELLGYEEFITELGYNSIYYNEKLL